MEVIAAGANVPFADQEIFFGPIAEYTDNRISVIPDFISNCGMARVFAFLMTDSVEMTDEGIFHDTSETIKKAIQKVFEVSAEKTKISKRAFTIALSKLI